ncbi:MAG: phosphoglucosamine mutase [Kiloniellales bacterium]
MSRKYFGTDGIRAKANQGVMRPESVLKIAMATALHLRQGSHRQRAVIGKDTRLSGYMIESAFTSGFTAMGVDTFLVGPVPTPAVAMLTRSLRADIGVVLSASHNRFYDNGIKLFGADGYKLSDATEIEIEALMDQDLERHLAGPEDLGRATRIESARDRYVEFAKRTMPRSQSLEGLRVVVDCAHGAGYRVAPSALWELGADVVSLSVEPNGTNINEDCGATSISALQRKVREVRADIGIALDGDADRLIVVDEKSRVVDGDQLMAVIARSWAEDERLSRPGVVATVMSNLGLERYLAGEGLELSRTKVGDRYVVNRMREAGFNLGGEQSGHIIMTDYATTGDGLVSALQLLSVIQRLGRPVSEVCHRFDPVPQVLKNVRVTGPHPLEDAAVQKAIASGEQRLGNTGRLVIRPSGTEPLIRVMGEGDDADLVNLVVDDIIDALSKVA